MPVLKHAKKKLRQDKKRTLQNKKMKDLYKKLVKKARETKSQKAVDAAVSSVDKAVKHYIIHKNKGSRLKSSLAKLTAKSGKKISDGEKKTAAVVKKETAKVAAKVASSKKATKSVKKTVAKKTAKKPVAKKSAKT